MPEDSILVTAILILIIVVIGLAALVIINYRRDDLPSKPTQPYMSDDEWDGR